MIVHSLAPGSQECVVTVATEGYRAGQERLVGTLHAEKRYRGDILEFYNEMPPGSPTHKEVPYAFKLHALAEARRRYRFVFWFDASVYAIAPVAPLFEILREQGYCLWDAGWYVGQWCMPAPLARLGISREEALTIPMTLSGAVGFDFENESACALFDNWFQHATDGVSFLGPWKNSGECADARVLGHRHDMPFLSFHARRLGLKHFSTSHLFEYWSPSPKPATILLARGI